MLRPTKESILLSIAFLLSLLLVTPAWSAKYDFNFDNTSDVLFQNIDDGRLLFWTVNNLTRTGIKTPTSMASSWKVAGKGDFNGDGTSDIFYVRDDGTTAIAEFTNVNRSNLKFIGGINPIWKVQGIGDFNGDGTDDILWRRSTDGVTIIWGINNSTRTRISWPGAIANFWDIVGVGDFNNDGTDDILCQHNEDGRLLIWKMRNYGRSSVVFPKSLADSWTAVGVGDFNSDGTDDVFYLKGTGDTAIAEFNNLKRSTLKFPGGLNPIWQVKDIGDYNGDGSDDLLWRRSTDSITMFWSLSNSVRSKIVWPGGISSQWSVKRNFSREHVTEHNITTEEENIKEFPLWFDIDATETWCKEVTPPAGGTITNIDCPGQVSAHLFGKYLSPPGAMDVELVGPYAYVANFDKGIYVFYLGIPSQPSLIGSYNTPGLAYKVTIKDNIAYVADGTSGIQILNISNPANPQLIGTYNTLGDARDIIVRNNYAFVADSKGGMLTLDISTPSQPKYVSIHYYGMSTSHATYGVTATNNILYVAGNYGLVIFDISDPQNLKELSTYSTNAIAHKIVIVNDLAYIANNWLGLLILDVSDPTKPKYIGRGSTTGKAYDVSADGKFAYVADYTGGLQIFNTKNPTNPINIGNYNAGSNVWGVTESSGLILLATENQGIQLVVLSEPICRIQYQPNNNFYGTDKFTLMTGSDENYPVIHEYNVTVNQVYDQPVVEADLDVEVRRNELVQLNGRGSYSPDDLPITYQWIQTAGTLVFMDDNTSPTPQFLAPDVEGVLTFELKVSDGTTTVSDIVKVFVVYDPPVANAGETQNVARLAHIQLDASGSYSPEGSSLTYSWTQTLGAPVALANANTATPTFTTADTLETLEFQVQVSDGYGSATDTVTIEVINQQPVADAGLEQTVAAGSLVTLDGSATYDLDGQDTLTYTWSQIWGPDNVTLNNPNIASPSFTAPTEISVIIYELAVEDGQGGRSVSEVTIIVEPPAMPPLTTHTTNMLLTIPSGSDLTSSTTTYSSFGLNSALDSSGNGAAEILDGGAPSMGIVLDGAGEPFMLGLQIPPSLSIYLDRFPELSPYLADGNATVPVDATSTTLGMLLMNPYMLQTDGVQRMAFLGSALTHPTFNTLLNRINTMLATPGVRLVDILEDLTAKTYYAQITTDLTALVLPALELGETFDDDSTIPRAMVTDTSTSTATNDEGRQHEVILRKPVPEFRNPYFVFYGADITKNPSSSADRVWQLLHRRTSLVSFSWLTGPQLPKYAATPYPFRSLGSGNVTEPYHVTLRSNKNFSTAAGLVQVVSVFIGLDTVKIPAKDYVTLATSMDFTAVGNMGENAAQGDWVAVAANIGDLVAQNFTVFTDWMINKLLGDLSLDAGFKTLLTTITGNSNLAGQLIKSAKLINTTAPLMVDLFAAPEGCEMNVEWDPSMGFNDVLISTPCNALNNEAPDLDVTVSTTSGTVPLQVTFDASNSTDPNGDPLFYSYTLNPLAKAPVATTPIYTHTFTRPGEYTMRASVSDGEFGDSADITITVSPASTNTAPTANAGVDQYVQPGDVVTLNGLLSNDPEGDDLTWQWKQVNGIRRALKNPRTATPQFRAPGIDDVLVYEITVSDGQYSSSDLVQVVVGSPSGGTLSFNGITNINEGSNLTASVQLSETATTDKVIWLESTPSDTIEHPSYILVPAGQTSTSFGLTALPDSDEVNDDFTVTATASGWTNANVSAQVVEINNGDIRVSTSPCAYFSISGPSINDTFYCSKSLDNVTAGTYSVNYVPMAGYKTPPSETKSVGNSGYYRFYGSYQKIIINSADITVSTSGAPNASWTISGPSVNGSYSGTMSFNNVTPGTYTVTYQSVSGYQTPSPQSQYVGSSGGVTFTGTYYTQSLGDVTVTKTTNIQLTLYDHGAIDGDIVDVYLNGSKVLSNHTLVGPPGTTKSLTLNSGANTLSIKALNEGTESPNTATVTVSDVSNGTPTKVYGLGTGASAGFKIFAP